MPRRVFKIDLVTGANPLLAHPILNRIATTRQRHHTLGLRAPLGIYNTSISRIFDKVTALCTHIEAYFKLTGTLAPHVNNDRVMEQVIDYVELAIYAAAEHVDDVSSIVDGFFKTTSEANRVASYRSFVTAIKKHKRLIAAAANAIKHQQSRIRLFSMEYSHAENTGALHGYFIEGVTDGAVGPSGQFHSQQQVFSLTALPWEIIMFVLNCSQELRDVLESLDVEAHGATRVQHADGLNRAVAAAARLPLYTFGEMHPFDRDTLEIDGVFDRGDGLASGLYGSLGSPWKSFGEPVFKGSASRFEADGVTKTFRFAQPKSIGWGALAAQHRCKLTRRRCHPVLVRRRRCCAAS
ncbi:MAG TPA: hypothetical protein VM512_15175 [Burkholderiaceae bacterium]|nr:hypothetical protein [Burkholderiaceae bacterium]